MGWETFHGRSNHQSKSELNIRNILMISAIAVILIFYASSVVSTNDIWGIVKPYPQRSIEQYNLLRHGGGLGPFIPHEGYGINPDTPPNCEIDQVHLLLRHGERYPSSADGNNQKDMISNLQKIPVKDNVGPLAFVKDYKYFAQDSDFEQLSTRGVYSGARDAHKQGRHFRRRYGHLYNSNDKLPVFAASDKRVVDTLKNFANGFLAEENGNAAIQIIPETRPQGANTLAPSTFCKTYDRNINDDIIDKFSQSYLSQIVERLETESPDYKDHLNNKYVFHMMEICLFELNTMGDSQWCDLFTEDEWLQFSYQRDLIFYYQSSFGHDKSLGIGSNYLNATITLLNSELNEKIFASFTHDTDMTPVLVPLGLFNNIKLSTDHISFNSFFKSSQIVPMGARFVFERLRYDNMHYVRIKIGDSVIPIPDCSSGPGFSCKLNEFVDLVKRNLNGTTYIETCDTDKDLPQHLTFFWDWKTHNYK